MNCYETIDHMGDALEGRLSPELIPGFDEHLEECPPCRTYLNQLRITLTALERLPRAGVDSRRREALISAYRREHSRND